MILGQVAAAGTRPLVGISCGSENGKSQVYNNYSQAILQAGGIPVLLPVITDSVTITAAIARLDGVLLTGGGDIDPSCFGEEMVPECGMPNLERDTCEMLIVKAAHRLRKPLLGICRGEQVLNVAYGGTLYQDLPTQFPSDIAHKQSEAWDVETHSIDIAPGSMLAHIAGCKTVMVNTFHHQAVKAVAPGFKATAWSGDGVVEAIEGDFGWMVMGVQFHPERLYANGGDNISAKLFRHFIEQAAR